MQTIYAMGCKENNNLQVEGKFVNDSIAQVYNLYLLMLDMMVEVHAFAKSHSEKLSKKILATEEEKNPNTKFITNEVLVKLSENALLQDELDKRKLKNWTPLNAVVCGISLRKKSAHVKAKVSRKRMDMPTQKKST